MIDKRFLKDKTNNLVDWYNLNSDCSEIFNSSKKYAIEDKTSVVLIDGKLDEEVMVIHKDSIEVLKELDGLEVKTYSKYHMLIHLRFKGQEMPAYNHIKYKILKVPFPYIRVGTDYYKLIQRTDRYGSDCTEIKQWKKEEIKQDYGPPYLKMVEQYDDFTIEPNNVDYKSSIKGLYNQYQKFSHTPFEGEVTEADIPNSMMLMRHIFNEQLGLGLDYMKVLYEHPKQIIYILCLVSSANNTGKTTFINWLQMIFGQSSIQISPEEIGGNFNYVYATKNLILIEEAVTEKTSTVEKLKALTTQKFITVNRKNVSEYSIPFFGKVVMCTNKEEDFIRINEEETRFWIRKIDVIPAANKNINIEADLFKEIPKFLTYLSQLKDVDFTKHRMVFTPEEIQTEAIFAVKEESRSGLHKDLVILIEDLFHNCKDEFIKAGPLDIKGRWYQHQNNVSAGYIKKVLKHELKLNPENNQRYIPFEIATGISKVGMPYVFERKDFVKTPVLKVVKDDINQQKLEM